MSQIHNRRGLCTWSGCVHRTHMSRRRGGGGLLTARCHGGHRAGAYCRKRYSPSSDNGSSGKDASAPVWKVSGGLKTGAEASVTL